MTGVAVFTDFPVGLGVQVGGGNQDAELAVAQPGDEPASLADADAVLGGVALGLQRSSRSVRHRRSRARHAVTYQSGGSLRGCAKTEVTVRDGPYCRLRPQLADSAANECPRGAHGEGPCRAPGHSTRSAA